MRGLQIFMKTKDYISEIEKSLAGCDEMIEKIVSVLLNLRKTGSRLWILGNGGSMAIAQHFAQDLLKMRGIRAHALNCPSILTAYTNDYAFDYSAYGPIKVLAQEGDIIFIFSCSGKSRNYIEFVSWGEYPIISIVGTDGGFLKEKSTFCVHVSHYDYALCESAFSVIADLISLGLEKNEGDICV